jgi:dolichol-phosphate mannosyltransferase
VSRLSVVIAAYDEEENVGPLTRRLQQALAPLAGWSVEILYVVEGTDRTREVLEGLAPEIPGLRILYQEKPGGIGAAFRRGFAAVSPATEWVVTLDADLNHQPEEIPRLLDAACRRGCGVLIGSRFLDGSAVEGTPLWKRFLSGAMNHLMRLLYGLRVADKTSGFRVYRAEVLRRVRFENDAFAFLPEILILAHRAGFTLAEEPIHFIYRKEGRSKMGLSSTSLSYLRLLRPRFAPRRRGAGRSETGSAGQGGRAAGS